MALQRPPTWVAQAIVARAGPQFWPEFARAVERALSGLDVTLNSWWRSAAGQEALRRGGAPAATYSQHLIGTAIDCIGPDAWPSTRAKERLEAEGFYVLHHAGHTHAQAFTADQATGPALRDLFVKVGAAA